MIDIIEAHAGLQFHSFTQTISDVAAPEELILTITNVNGIFNFDNIEASGYI